HGHGDDAHHAKTGDNNIRSAYLHVIADALTSVLAIAALTLGSLYGWLWLDPLMGIVGGLVIANWSWSLMKSSGGVLLDVISEGETLPAEIRGAIETEDDRIT
ncbi:cation transporter, partial [Rhizobium ruizarguesonis]